MIDSKDRNTVDLTQQSFMGAPKTWNLVRLDLPRPCNLVTFLPGQILSLGHQSSLFVHARDKPFGLLVLIFIYFTCPNKRINRHIKYCIGVILQYMVCCSLEPRTRRLRSRASKDPHRFLSKIPESVITSKIANKHQEDTDLSVYYCNFWGRKCLGTVSSGQ